MKYLGLESEELTKMGAIHTAREISQQPLLWKKIGNQIYEQRQDIQNFLAKTKGVTRIILTGAGTSAFIGLSLRGLFQRSFNVITEALATTDLVTHPQDFFKADGETLLVSFARSGNSPESAAAAKLADEFSGKCHHLIITCNAEGLLARHETPNHKFVFCLPNESNDLSLAMTSSYTGMLLAGNLIANIGKVEPMLKKIDILSQYGDKAIAYYASELRQLASVDFKRAVFLGAGPFFGTAIESHLKLQELSDGKVICKNDSYLGFRHGPKAVIDSTTLVMYIFSNNKYSLQYEKDLVHAMKKGHAPMLEVGISESVIDGITLDHTIVFSENGKHGLEEDLLAICSVLPAQILGFYKSIQLGLKPDAPSVTGAISRVVEGVNIYSMK